MNINLLGLISTAKNVIIIRTIAAKRLFITAPWFFWRSETLSVSDTSWAIIRSLSVWLNGVNCVAHSLAQNRIWVIHSNIFFYTIPIWSQSESDTIGERGCHKDHKQTISFNFNFLNSILLWFSHDCWFHFNKSGMQKTLYSTLN